VTPGSEEERNLLEAFADRRIGRQEAEERTGLYLSEILLRLGELGITRRPVRMYEGMSEEQRQLFDQIFPDPDLDASSPG
jgi:hypothetical protein